MNLFSKFKNNLQKTSDFLSSNILSSFQNKKVDKETLEELETVLISADISLDVVEKLINSVRKVKTSSMHTWTLARPYQEQSSTTRVVFQRVCPV